MPLLTCCLLLPPAFAHPGSAAGRSDPNGGMPGQRVELRVEPGGVRVDYFAEIAAIRLYKEAKAEAAAGPEWAEGKAEALRAGVRLRQAGVDLPLAALPVESPAQLKEAAFVELHVAANVAVDPTAGELELRMDNFADEACYYAVSVQVDGGLVVTGTDLGHVKDGRLRDNQHGAWRRDDTARIARLSVRRTHPWEDHTAGPLPERIEGLVDLDGRVVTGGVALGAAAALAGLGVALRAWRRRALSGRDGG